MEKLIDALVKKINSYTSRKWVAFLLMVVNGIFQAYMGYITEGNLVTYFISIYAIYSGSKGYEHKINQGKMQ
jgi:hypothetical protein